MDVVDVFKGSEPLSGSAERTLARLANAAARRSYPQGSYLFWEGEQPSSCFLIGAGVIELSKARSNRVPFVIDHLGPGDLVGEATCALGYPRTASARAVVATTAWSIPRSAFMSALSSDPGLARGLFLSSARALIDRYETLAARGALPVTTLVAQRILQLTERHGGASLHLRHSDLAALLGISRETVSRSLASLKRAGAISTARGSITVLDGSLLDRWANAE